MEIIKSSAEISSLFDQGRRVSTPYVTLIVLKQNDRSQGLSGRVAFIAGKKGGNAVWRNRAKRRMRAVYQNLGTVFPGYDMVFLAKAKIQRASYQQLCDAISRGYLQVTEN